MSFIKGYKPWNKGNSNSTKIINCLNCKKEKEVKNSEINRGNGKYCSLKCAALSSHLIKRKQVNTHLSKHRLKEGIINFFKEKNEYFCHAKNCSFNIILDLHRIKTGKEGGKYNTENTILLCPNHHSLITRKIKTFKQIIEGE